jgi:hypothetical protein
MRIWIKLSHYELIMQILIWKIFLVKSATFFNWFLIIFFLHKHMSSQVKIWFSLRKEHNSRDKEQHQSFITNWYTREFFKRNIKIYIKILFLKHFSCASVGNKTFIIPRCTLRLLKLKSNMFWCLRLLSFLMEN